MNTDYHIFTTNWAYINLITLAISITGEPLKHFCKNLETYGVKFIFKKKKKLSISVADTLYTSPPHGRPNAKFYKNQA
jgi:hypothetical protein